MHAEYENNISLWHRYDRYLFKRRPRASGRHCVHRAVPRSRSLRIVSETWMHQKMLFSSERDLRALTIHGPKSARPITRPSSLFSLDPVEPRRTPSISKTESHRRLFTKLGIVGAASTPNNARFYRESSFRKSFEIQHRISVSSENLENRCTLWIFTVTSPSCSYGKLKFSLSQTFARELFPFPLPLIFHSNDIRAEFTWQVSMPRC